MPSKGIAAGKKEGVKRDFMGLLTSYYLDYYFQPTPKSAKPQSRYVRSSTSKAARYFGGPIAMTIREAQGEFFRPNSNPHFIEEEYENNCLCCVLALEMRFRGLDVGALGKNEAHLAVVRGVPFESFFVDPETGEHPTKYYYVAADSFKEREEYEEPFDAINEIISHDSRWAMEWKWFEYDYGHIVMIGRNYEGNLTLVDPQTGEICEGVENIIENYFLHTKGIEIVTLFQISGMYISPKIKGLMVENRLGEAI